MSFTVLTAEFSHETNTFSIRPTDHAAFTDRYCLFGDDALAKRCHANIDLAGFMDVARARGWRTIHTLSTSAAPAGLVTRAAFEPIAGKVIVCDSGALCTPDLASLPYRNVPRPIFPLNDADDVR